MPQFIALVWNTQDSRAKAGVREFVQALTESTVEWNQTLAAPGLLVFHKELIPGTWQAHLLQGATGVVFGQLFRQQADSDGYPTIDVLSPSESARIVTSKTRHLIDYAWGRYIAIVRDQTGRSTWLLRDPQGGGVPCMQTPYKGVQIFFSNMEECLPRELFRFSINKDQIAAHLCDVSLSAHASAINEITFVTPGECITIHSDTRIERELYWKPTEFARKPFTEDIDEAAREIRKVTRHCVWSWVRNHQRIMHNLSGGLDSAVVLSCLVSAPNKPFVLCANNYDLSEYGDERVTARLAAARAGCELVEIENKIAQIDLDAMCRPVRSPIPGNYQGGVQNAEVRSEIARKWQLEVATDGSAGDALFYNLDKRLIPTDYLLHFGFGWKFIQTAAAVARVEQASAWTLIKEAIKTRMRPRTWKIHQDAGAYQRLLNPEIIAAVRQSDRWIHPWLRETDGIPPGKQSHINMLTFTFEGHGIANKAILPKILLRVLLSEPLMRLCLGTPTFVHSPCGTPRVVQRKAFVDDIPPEIVERTSKGIVDASLINVVTNNRSALREFIQDGWLVSNGFLDRRKLAGVLSDENRLFSEGTGDLLEYLAVETWARAALQ